MAESADLQILKASYEEASNGDVEALSRLFAPEAVWRGIERGVLWWKRAPS